MFLGGDCKRKIVQHKIPWVLKAKTETTEVIKSLHWEVNISIRSYEHIIFNNSLRFTEIRSNFVWFLLNWFECIFISCLNLK